MPDLVLSVEVAGENVSTSRISWSVDVLMS